MGFLAQLFGKGEEPDKSCSDEVLGPLEWSEDDEAWFGEYKGAKFSVAYDRLKQPGVEIVTYAREVLCDPGWLASTLAEAKKRARQQYGDFCSSEIDSLSFDRIHFYLHKESVGSSLTFTEAKMTGCGGLNIVNVTVKGLVLIDEP